MDQLPRAHMAPYREVMTMTSQDLVGMAELGYVLGGLSRTSVGRLTAEPSFPEPVARLRMGKVWHLADVKVWAENRTPPRVIRELPATWLTTTEDAPPSRYRRLGVEEQD